MQVVDFKFRNEHERGMAAEDGEFIVADGKARERAACQEEIVRRMHAKYATEWAESNFLRRLVLRLSLRSAIAKDLNRWVPGDGLYLRPR